MKHSFLILAVLFALLLTATACSTATQPAPSPSLLPSVMPTASATPMASPPASPMASESPQASGEPAPDAKARKVGDNIALYVGDEKVNADAYYDARNVMVFPLADVSKALGWEETTEDGMPSIATITKGSESVNVIFTKPPLGKEEATDVSAKKGTETLTIDTTQLFTDNKLYVPETFLDSAFGELDITFNNTDRITITPAG